MRSFWWALLRQQMLYAGYSVFLSINMSKMGCSRQFRRTAYFDLKDD